MKLAEIQERFFRAVTQPLTADERMRHTALNGTSLVKEAEAIVKPNDRLTSFERLEIYNRQYWFRLLGSLMEDFPGLQAIVGEKAFEKLSQQYLLDHPSRSPTLRELGSRLHDWLQNHPEHVRKSHALALDMVRLEWANIECFDAMSLPPVTRDELLDFASNTSSLRLRLQPSLQLICVHYPVDEIRLAVKDGVAWASGTSNAVTSRRRKGVKHDFTGLQPEQTHIAIHRQEHTVYYKRIDAESYRLLCSLSAGRSLLSAITSAFKGSAIPEINRADYLREAFAHWSALGWLCRR